MTSPKLSAERRMGGARPSSLEITTNEDESELNETYGDVTSSLVANDDNDANDANDNFNDSDAGSDGNELPLPSKSLQQRIVECVKSSRQLNEEYVVRPAYVAQTIGVSLQDANAELCGLLQAVGPGSSFAFETIDVGGKANKNANANANANAKNEQLNASDSDCCTPKPVPVMVFRFPLDFEKRAKWAQQRDDFKAAAKRAFHILIKMLKIFTAFGLLLSLLIVSVAVLVAMVAAIVAMSQSTGNDRHAQARLRQFCALARQILWCYALFGSDNNGDPFMRDAAYDTSLMLSLCWGNPASIWFWIRAQQLQQRRQRAERGWGRRAASMFSRSSNSNNSGVDGVTLVHRNRGEWGQPEESESRSSTAYNAADRQGILSIAVEFLFGPDGGQSLKPSESIRWKLRGAVILEKPSASVALRDFMPYSDNPPPSPSTGSDDHQILTEGLTIVTHFGGVPAEQNNQGANEARFSFPELMAEGGNMIVDYSEFSDCVSPVESESSPSWQRLFYQDSTSTSGFRRVASLPKYLHEQPLVFSRLPARGPLLYCVGLGLLNLWGVLWLSGAVRRGGIIENAALDRTLLPVLQFYSVLFFAIPLTRLAWIAGVRNPGISRRNARRKAHAETLDMK